jgi:hypothetical protein
MVVTAQTPGAQSAPSSDPSTLAISPSSQATSPDGTSDRKVVRHSEKVRIVVAGACLLLAALGALATALNPGEQPLKLVAFLIGVTATVVTLLEAATSWVVVGNTLCSIHYPSLDVQLSR